VAKHLEELLAKEVFPFSVSAPPAIEALDI